MSKFKIFFFLQSLFFLSLPVLAQVDTGWVRRYSGGDAKALTVDNGGNVYVTGTSYDDYATIKYASNGDTLWVRRYGYSYESASALAVDGNGNVYVTGLADGEFDCTEFFCYLVESDYGTIKYAPNGDTLWVRKYDVYGSVDGATALAVDVVGNVYVTGNSNYGYGTIKYAPNGDTLWVRHYGYSSNDFASALAVDDSGNVYVTGYSYGNGTSFDYATIKYAPNGDTLWVRRYNGPGNYDDRAYALALDSAGNVYVTGLVGAVSGTYDDYATIKYAPNGDTLWVRRYNGPANEYDRAYALAVDDSGNVYVTGNSGGSGTSYDYATIKYAPNGDTLWVRRYDGPENVSDEASALALDTAGNVYVTGSSANILSYPHNYDYATIKYAPNGDTLWVRRYNGPGNYEDSPSALAVDGSGNVYVTGFSGAGGYNLAYVTIKYNKFGCAALAGDVNSDYNVDLSDIMLQINYIFKAGPKPDPFCSGDANANGNILLTDIVYLINYIFRSGLAPLKSNECCL